jgi:D-alanyl-D-alanine carboxypeptidase (penicillin-binding protein 5/6)
MIKYAEEKYKYISIYKKGGINNKLRVYGGNVKYVEPMVTNDLYIPVLKDDSETVEVEAYVPSVLFSPISENEVIGNIVAYIKDKVVAKYPIYSNMEVKKKN